MADLGEVARIRKDTAFVRRVAARLLDYTWTGKAKAVLEDVAVLREDHRNAEGFFFSTREAEFLRDVREESECVESFEGFSLRALLDACRLDLEFDGDVDIIAPHPSLLPGAWRD